MKFHIEINMTIGDHVPVIIQAQGNDLDSVLEDATYNIDCPDPSTHLHIGNLSQHNYDKAVRLITEEIATQGEAFACAHGAI